MGIVKLNFHNSGFHLGRCIFLGVLSLGAVSCRLDMRHLSQVKSGGNTRGNYRGIDKVEEVLSSRLTSSSVPFQLLYSYAPPDLRYLLGTYTHVRGNVIFENGVPNELNSMLWDQLFKQFATDLAYLCRDDQNTLPERASETLKRLRPEITATLKKACSWPQASAKNELYLQEIWLAVMRYDAPESEFLAWKDYFLNANSGYTDATGREVLRAMIASILLNPFFLFEQ